MTTQTLYQQESNLSILNRALVMLQLPLANTLFFPTLTDASIVLDHLITVHRQVGALGWYCFNRIDRLTPNKGIDVANNGSLTMDNVFTVRRSLQLPADPEWVHIRAMPHSVPGQPNAVTILRTGMGGNYLSLTATDHVCVDAFYAYQLYAAPEPYIDYVVRRAVRELAPSFGASFDAQAESVALATLKEFEYMHEPSANAAEDSADTVLTWMRR